MTSNNEYKMSDIIPIPKIENQIYIFRGQKVMIDSDLAEIYGVKTKVLNQAVKRNIERFPDEFMFQLSKDEFKNLKSQTVTSSLPDGKAGWGGRRISPYAFTEHGTVMLASVLKSEIAIKASIQIVKAFVKFREIIASQAELAKKIDKLESKYDDQFKQVFDVIKQLIISQPSITTIKKGRKD